MELVIRPAVPDDAEQIVAVLNPIILAGRFTVFAEPFSVEAERAYIDRLPERGLFLVAVERANERIVGFQSMEPFAGFTRAFDHVGTLGTYVAEERRRLGVATALFAATFAAARDKGFEKLFTYVRADNPGALAAYLAHGFGVVGTARRHAKLNGRYIDETLIEKQLG